MHHLMGYDFGQIPKKKNFQKISTYKQRCQILQRF